MALVKCPECGKEISSGAKRCPYCGYPLKSIAKVSIGSIVKVINKKVIISVCVCLTLLLVVKILMRPNIKMEDFNSPNGKVATLLFLGIPSEVDDEWCYGECGIKFYDIPVKCLYYDFSDGSYSLIFDSEFNYNLKNILSKHCNYSRRIYTLQYYTYMALEISVSYDSYISIINVRHKN